MISTRSSKVEFPLDFQMSTFSKREKFSTIEELELSAASRGISPGDLVTESGIFWNGYSVVFTEDGIFHFFRDGMEIGVPDSLVDISVVSTKLCDGTTEKVVVPDSITSIEDGAFSGCTGLTDVTIPNSVTSIGDYAFSGCRALTSVTIPGSVTSIEAYAFSSCRGLTSVTIPDSVTTIGWYAFYGCRGLTSVTIPDSVTNIGNYAFCGCNSLTCAKIPGSVTIIGDWAFFGFHGLTRITIPRRFENILEKIGIDRDKTKVSFSG